MATGPFEKGDKIRAKIQARLSGEDGKFSTTTVREVLGSEGDGYRHFLFLRSELVTSTGEFVTAEFDAVVDGAYLGEDLATTQVREIRPDGAYPYTHFLFLRSDSVTRIEPEPRETVYAKGDKIKISITGGAVGDRQGDVPADDRAFLFNTTTRVFDGDFDHFIYAVIDGVRKNPDFETANVEFEAEISDEPGAGPDGTTQVRDTAENYVHYVFLGSGAVTKVEPEPEPEPEPPKQPYYSQGEMIDVSISGARLGEDMRNSKEGRSAKLFNTTTQVIDRLYSHYLYTNGDTVIVRESGSEATVSAEFRAKIEGEPFAGPNGSTRARDQSGCVHYVNLYSDSVTRVEPEPEPEPEYLTLSTAGTIGAVPDDALTSSYIVPSNPQPGGSDQRITDAADEIESSAVLARIAELEDRKQETRYNVVRRSPRAGQPRVISERYGSFPAAVEFINDNDYDVSKVGVEVTGGEGNLADAEELEELRKLNQAGLNVFGSTEWITESVLLLPEAFFSADWAREQAAEDLNQDLDNLGYWPFSMLDWDYAAGQRRDEDYNYVYFNDTRYWGVNR